MMIILIVENSAPVRRMIRGLVAPLAEQIFECADGSEAVAAYELYHPDWVLMDIEMEKMDGLTATQAIHTSDPQARIAIVTSYDDDDLRAKADASGACAYIIKDELYKLRALLGDKQTTNKK